MNGAHWDLTGKVALVTGGSKGLGKAMARELATAGADIVISSRNQEELDAAMEEILAGTDSRGETVVADMTVREDVERLGAVALERMGRVDVLVNNAGYNKIGKILDCDEELYDLIVDANLKNVFFCSQIAARQMIAQGYGGNIVNISSQAGVVGAPERGPYSGAKGGVNNLTKTMAAEWAEYKIRVNAVAPTVTRSPLAEAAMEASVAFSDAVRTKNLLRGALAEPEEMSAPVIFLASEAASMITGHTLVVDGGWTII